MRLSSLFVSLSLLTAGLVAPPADAATQNVSAVHLRLGALSKFTKGGKIQLTGFAWDGAAKPFPNRLEVEVASVGQGFSVAAKGPVALCEGLRELGASQKTLERGRLSFHGSAGPLHALRLEGVTVGAVDCSKTPWTAALEAAAFEEAAERTKGKAKGKAKGKKKANS